jgi:hypothetical protein
MADLSPPDRSRGQLILVAGFAIAVAIVALVLLLNTAIYSENLATRSVDTGGEDALAFRDAVEDDLWGVVRGANDWNGADRDRAVRNVGDRTDRFADMAARRHRLSASSARIDNRTYHNGTRLEQADPGREVRAASALVDWNWTMATDADDIRAVEMNVTGGLASTTTRSEAFRLTVTNDVGDAWTVYVYNDSAAVADPTTVDVVNGTGTFADVCSGQFAGPPTMNLSAGRINGTACAPLSLPAGLDGPYDTVTVTYGNRSTGTYTLTVNTTLTAAAGNYNAPTASPYAVPVVYSMQADVVYQSASLTYRARIYAGPEEEPP